MQRSVVVLLAVGCLLPSARARAEAGPQSLTLREALRRAVAGNVDLRKQNVALRASAANVVAAEGQFDVVVGADASFTRRVSPGLRPGDQFGGATNTYL